MQNTMLVQLKGAEMLAYKVQYRKYWCHNIVMLKETHPSSIHQGSVVSGLEGRPGLQQMVLDYPHELHAYRFQQDWGSEGSEGCCNMCPAS
jgi:hypothetical protein